MHMPKDKSVMTFKAGKFIFTAKHDSDVILPLVVQVTELQKSVFGTPRHTDVLARIEPYHIRRAIFGTASIEGNAFSEDEVASILATNENQRTYSNRHEREIVNLANCYEILRAVIHNGTCKMSEEVIRKIHKNVTCNIDYGENVPGCYRNSPVVVGDADHGGVYRPPKSLKDIEILMQAFIEWMNSDEMLDTLPMLRAACAHYYLGRVHPFNDGNGRTARFVETLLLRASGYRLTPLILPYYYYKKVDDYFTAFSKSGKQGDITPFLKMHLSGIVASLLELQKVIT